MERTFFCQLSECLNLGLFQCTNNPICDNRRFVQLVLPNANNLPSFPAQLATNTPVAFPVIGDFGIPKLLIAAREFVAFWATVPKAAVHKNDNALAPKSEIRFAKQGQVASPAGDMKLPKNFNQAQL